MDLYYIIGILSYGTFIIQFIATLVLGDIDLDVDFDGNIDFNVSDLVSFKGLIHFLMGYSGWIILTDSTTLYNNIIAIIVGLVFVIILYYIYRLILKLNYEPIPKSGTELIGTKVTVYLTMADPYKCICTINNSCEINCISRDPVSVGDIRTILNYRNGIYFI
jgi:hypothetical protein